MKIKLKKSQGKKFEMSGAYFRQLEVSLSGEDEGEGISEIIKII